MEKDTDNLPEFDSNRALDYSHVSQEIEDEIKRVKQALAYLESKSAQARSSTGVFDSNCCLKGKAKSVYHNSDISPPLSTLTIYPVFQPPKRGPPKEDDDQEKDMKSTVVDINNGISKAEVPCDDASGNTGYSKNAISSGDKDIGNDEVVSTLESSTPAEHLQCNKNVGEVVDEVPLTTAIEDTGSHTLVDDLPLTEQTLPPSTPLSALELETKKMVYSFNDTGELPDTIQEQDSQPYNVPPLVTVVNPVQESNGQSDTNKEINTHQTAIVSSEEKFELSP